MISKQKAFNKSLFDENTQIIFLDEAYAKLMDPDDWKYWHKQVSLHTTASTRRQV